MKQYEANGNPLQIYSYYSLSQYYLDMGLIRMVATNPSSDHQELQLCCLLKSDFSTKEISVVIQQSVRTVYQRKTVIRQKLGMEEKEDIAEFLSV